MEKSDIIRIGVLGAESTGKTWLAEKLAAHYQTLWVPEYAREFFDFADIYRYTSLDLVHIARMQKMREEERIGTASSFLFCDTTGITVKIWSELEFGHVVPEIDLLVQHAAHDFYLICDNSIAWAPDPLRLNKFDRELILRMNISEVEKIGRPYGVVTGTESERLRQAITVLDAFMASRRP